MDKDKKASKHARSAHNSDSAFPTTERERAFGAPDAAVPRSADLDDLYQKLQAEMQRPKPSPDVIAAALEAVQSLASEADLENSATVGLDQVAESGAGNLCRACGYRNRGGNKFCAMCGQPVDSGPASERNFFSEEDALSREALPGQRYDAPVSQTGEKHASGGPETHYYHHHYHHHYFPGGQQASIPRHSSESSRDIEKLRGSPVLRGESMSRAEAAVRRITQEWVLACNTKHLDDLLELYSTDALVLRSNYPPVRGAAAVREFFFSALDAGLGEVEVDPIRVEVVGDLAYEAGRCKALVPGSTGKRREERGKYLWVFARQSNGEWKLASDCWSSDLTFTLVESEIPVSPATRTSPPRKSP